MSSRSPQGPAATKAGGTKRGGLGRRQVGQDPGLVADEPGGEVVPGRLHVADDRAVGGEHLEHRLAVEPGHAEDHGHLEVAPAEDVPEVLGEEVRGRSAGESAGRRTRRPDRPAAGSARSSGRRPGRPGRGGPSWRWRRGCGPGRWPPPWATEGHQQPGVGGPGQRQVGLGPPEAGRRGLTPPRARDTVRRSRRAGGRPSRARPSEGPPRPRSSAWALVTTSLLGRRRPDPTGSAHCRTPGRCPLAVAVAVGRCRCHCRCAPVRARSRRSVQRLAHHVGPRLRAAPALPAGSSGSTISRDARAKAIRKMCICMCSSRRTAS